MAKRMKVRTPKAGEWFRVNPDFREDVVLLTIDGTFFLLADGEKEKAVAKKFPVRDSTLFMVTNPENEYYFWPVHNPVPEDHLAFQAMSEWIQFPMLH